MYFEICETKCTTDLVELGVSARRSEAQASATQLGALWSCGRGSEVVEALIVTESRVLEVLSIGASWLGA